MPKFDGTSPASQYARATLGVNTPTPRHRSLPGTQEGQPSPAPPRTSFSSKKRLDPSDPSTWTSRHTPSFSERPRAASETVAREDVPTIRLQGDGEKSLGSSNPDINLDGSGADQSGAVSSPSKHNEKPVASSAAIEFPTVNHAVTSSPTGPALSVPTGAEADSRRFSNQSTSFSSVTTTDSDRIGPIRRESDAASENALQESSGSSDSDSSSSDAEDVGSPVSERGRQRALNREQKSAELRGQEQSTKTPGEPVIRGVYSAPQLLLSTNETPVEDTSTVEKQEHPHPPDASGKLSETQPHRFAPKSGIARASSPAALSAVGDDDAELKRAKELVLRVSPMDETVKDRSVKMIIRGEWGQFQDVDNETTESRHEPRLYLVCSDLSSEASHALEWTVGTLLKDGDTLLIINAIEDDSVPRHPIEEEPTAEIRMENAKAAEQATATMESLTRQTTNQEGSKDDHLKPKVASVKDARSVSRGSRPRSRRDTVRAQAVEKLEQDFLKFVRKTSLQVRTMIEVLHCRSPRHLILNAVSARLERLKQSIR